MIVGCYDLYLICDHPDPAYAHTGSAQFPGPGQWRDSGDTETLAQAKSKARLAGWTFTRDGRVLCPYCKRLGRKLPTPSENS